MSDRVSESPRGMSELLKSVAHPARMHVLVLLMEGNHQFSDLMLHTKLSKTPLANHMNRLAKMGLVQRVSRGEYTLTVDGKELLHSVSAVYRNSLRRKENQREALRSRYTRNLIEGKILNEKTIGRETVYQPCWLSYTGAMAGSLKALGVNCDIVDVGGYSGYAFLINVSRGSTCPSGPTALGTAWKRIHEATESLGWAIERYTGRSRCYPEVEGKYAPGEIEAARELFERVKREIDDRDQPVVLWGLVVPEYGIVTGYKGEFYLTSTYRHLTNQPEDPVLFYDLHAPGGLEAFFFREKAAPDPTQLGREALERALSFAEAEDRTLDNYVAGPAALDEWADVLESLPIEKQNYHGNSYVGACVCEGRVVAGEFLKRLASKYPGTHTGHLVAAAECYATGAHLMKEFTRIFPFKFQGAMKAEDRKTAAELLRKVKPLEAAAIGHMKQALNNWNSG